MNGVIFLEHPKYFDRGGMPAFLFGVLIEPQAAPLNSRRRRAAVAASRPINNEGGVAAAHSRLP